MRASALRPFEFGYRLGPDTACGASKVSLKEELIRRV
jgi:hypothetical protein